MPVAPLPLTVMPATTAPPVIRWNTTPSHPFPVALPPRMRRLAMSSPVVASATIPRPALSRKVQFRNVTFRTECPYPPGSRSTPACGSVPWVFSKIESMTSSPSTPSTLMPWRRLFVARTPWTVTFRDITETPGSASWTKRPSPQQSRIVTFRMVTFAAPKIPIP